MRRIKKNGSPFAEQGTTVQRISLSVKTANQQPSGFSSLECVMVLLILGVLLGVGWPLFNTRNPWQQSQWLATQLTTAIHYARMEAVTRGELLQLIPDVHDTQMRLKLVRHEKTKQSSQILHEWDWDTAPCEVQWYGFQKQGVLFSPDVYHVAANGYFLIHHGTKKMIKLVVNRWGKVHLEEIKS